ncbi:MAG: C1 family peptidase [Leptospira sp.]|nr:C1 family peptidase [Leptospira sp.]
MKHRKPMKLLLIALLTFSPLIAQEFDPNSVRSKNCKPDTFNCGYQPAPKEIQDTIPLKRDFNSFEDLPSSVDLSSKMPPVGNQGQQNSCVAWASGYAIKSYLAKSGGKFSSYDPPFAGGNGKNVFSPAFIYNQQNGGKDEGLYYYKTMDFLQKSGVVPWSSMPYSDKDYRSQPSASAKQEAMNYRIKSYSRLNIKKPDDIKRVLAGGNVVLFGIVIDDAFYKVKGSEIYDQAGGKSYGGHAMTIVGYDDNKKSKKGHQGAFKFQNSWGDRWGDKGFGWLSYGMLASVGQEAYALIDDTKINNTPNTNNVVVKPLSPPNNVNASRGESDIKITLNWEASAGAINYQIQRRDEEEKNFTDIAYSNTTSFIDTNVTPSTTYFYRVISMSNEESSGASKEVEGYTLAKVNFDANPPQVVGIHGSTSLEGNQAKVTITWSEIDGISNYSVSKATSGGKWKILGNVSSPSYTDSSPSKEATNTYRVRAVSSNRKLGAWSESFGIDIGSEEAELAPSGQVSDLHASDGEYPDKIVISWTQVPGATGYYVFRFDENAELSKEFTVSGSSYEDKDPKVLKGGYFSYTLYAYNTAGYSEQSDYVVGSVDPELAKRAAGKTLAPPANLSSEINSKDNKIKLKWKAVKDSNEYYVYRKLMKSKSGATAKKFDFVNSVPGIQTTYSENFPGSAGDLYLYSVRSKSEFGAESKDSNLVSVFLNPEQNKVKKRAFSLAELPKDFIGNWSGVYWNPKSGPQKLSLEVTGANQDFKANLKINDKVTKTYAGTWTPGSSGIRTNGMQLDLQKDVPGNSLVRLQGVSELGEDLEFSFSKN